MNYNLTPLFDMLKDNPNRDNWADRFNSFFINEDYDPELTDLYYNVLMNDAGQVKFVLSHGYLVDEYTGLFSFDIPQLETKHSFNLAYFIDRNHQHFYKKKLLTICNDLGILNIQIRHCGLNLLGTYNPPFMAVGTVLTCIGNNSPPYPLNPPETEDIDVLFASCVFNDDTQAYLNWSLMMDMRAGGKEVYFTTNTMSFLHKHALFERIEQIEDPLKVYDKHDSADLTNGYLNRIYKLT